MNRTLLIETNILVPSLLKEENSNNNGNIFIEGILATCEVENGNGRYYPRELWEREIKIFENKIKAGSTECAGELDHPQSEIINLNNVSHAIRKVWWNGDKIMGLIEIFSDQGPKGTTAGRIAGALIRNNLSVGVSSRGMGSLTEVNGVMEVQDDFSLLCWDLVSNPSNPNSWMKESKGSLNESRLSSIDKYSKVNSIITEILCSNGMCKI
jgi:hypothetical protein